jgi:hypothetical protein
MVRWWDGDAWTHHSEPLKKEEPEPYIGNIKRMEPYLTSKKPARPTQPFNVRNFSTGLVMPGISLDVPDKDSVELPGAQEVVGRTRGMFRLPGFRKYRQRIHKFHLVLEPYSNGDYDVAIQYKKKTVGYLTDFWVPVYLPFLKQLEDEGRDILVDGREYNTLGGRNVMVFLPKPEEFAIWLNTPSHLRRSHPPKLEESGAYLNSIGENTPYILSKLMNQTALHTNAEFTLKRVNSGDYAGMMTVQVFIDGGLIGELSPFFAMQFPAFYSGVVEQGLRTGRVYIDRLGHQSGVNHKGLRVIAFVQYN